MKKQLALALVSILAATASQAQSAYVDLAYQTFDSGWAKDPAALRINVGYDVHPNFAIEGMVGINAKKGSEDIYGVTASVKVDNMVGLYVRPKYNVSDAFEVYSRLGYARLKASASVLDYKVSDSDSDFSYGLGAAYSVNKNFRVFADYTRIVKSDSLAIGLGYKF